MYSLWPSNMLRERENGIRQLLDAQAMSLPEATGDRLYASVVQRLIEGVFVFEFRVHPRGNPEQSYELFRLRAPNGRYPCTVETYHLDKNERVQKAASQESLEVALKKIFQDTRTSDTLGLLAEEASDESSDALKGSPVLISSRLFKAAEGKLLAAVSFFGVSGFVSLTTLSRLVGETDTPESAYKTLSAGRFVATIQLEAPIKITLTSKQVEALQSAARTCLSTEDKALQD